MSVVFIACATGTAADDSSTTDSGSKTDSSINDGAPKQDTGNPKQDSGNPTQDSGGGNCGGQCLGNASTCCNNTCVDITSDPNNCGGCGSPCGNESCCAGNCVDTMGSDNANCGGCGITCSGTCTNGTCTTNTTCTVDVGSCSHSPCVVGAALSEACDPDEDTIFVCEFDGLPQCCTTAWDQSCVDDIANYYEDCSGC